MSTPGRVRREADRVICNRLRSLADEAGAEFVLGYLGLPDEVQIDAFLAAMIGKGTRPLLPRAAGGRLYYGPWRPCSTLSLDDEGVLAPDSGLLEALPESAGLIVVPGRAFDASGLRLGRGGGYYDRFLATSDPNWLIVGAAYECQVVEVVPAEGHDRSVDFVVTEVCCRGRGREQR